MSSKKGATVTQSKTTTETTFFARNKAVIGIFSFLVVGAIIFTVLWFLVLKPACHESGDNWCLAGKNIKCMSVGSVELEKIDQVLTNPEVISAINKAGINGIGISSTGDAFAASWGSSSAEDERKFADAFFSVYSKETVLNILSANNVSLAFAFKCSADKLSKSVFIDSSNVAFTVNGSDQSSFSTNVYVSSDKQDKGSVKDYCATAKKDLPSGVSLPKPPTLPANGTTPP